LEFIQSVVVSFGDHLVLILFGGPW